MITKAKLLSALLALLASVPLAAQGPPDPDTHPNVEDVKIGSTNVNKLEVKKNNTGKVKEIWKKVNNAWQKVWDLDTGGDFIVSSNSTLKTSIQNNPEGDDFTKDDEFRIVCEATDANGDSTVIEDIDQKT